MKITLAALAVLLLSLGLAGPAFAMDMDGEHCMHGDMDHSTIESLHHCVHHAVEMGHITNARFAESLHAKLNAAQAAADRGQNDVAIKILQAFINEVQAQSRRSPSGDGKFIGEMHADHLVHHAEMVITALEG